MTTKSKKILIIDDDVDDCVFIKEILESEGFTCEEAHSPIKGLEIAQTSPPDLILLDLMLPKMSGYGFLRELKKNQRTEKIPVVVLTTLTDKEIKSVSLEIGATAYLSKDLIDQKLISTVEQYAA